MTKEKLNELCKDLLEKGIYQVDSALETAKLSVDQINYLVSNCISWK